MFVLLAACVLDDRAERTGEAAPQPTGACEPLHLDPVAAWDEVDIPVVSQTGTSWPSVAAGDVTGDGLPDLVAGFPGGLVLARNGGAAGWTLEPLAAPGMEGEAVRAVALADLDGDDDLDAFFGGELGRPSWFATNDGAGAFTVAAIPGFFHRVWTGAFADLDGNGWVDVAAATYDADLDLDAILGGSHGAGQALVLRDEAGVSAPDGRFPSETHDGLSLQLAPIDHDQDGDLDLYLVDDFGPYLVPNTMLVNDGGAHFSAAEGLGCELAIYAMGAGVGDADGDGWPDLMVSDVGSPHLLLNDGTGRFVDATQALGAYVPPAPTNLTSWGTLFADLDQDTHDDVLVAYGGLGEVDVTRLEGADPSWSDDREQDSVLLRNTSEGFVRDDEAFTDRARARGVLVADLDLDGRPDVVTFGKLYLHIFATSGGCEPGVTVVPRGPVGNAHGFGARVDAVVGGQTSTRWMLPSVTAGQSALEVYVGSANYEMVDVTVTWPDGAVSALGELPRGSRVEVEPP